ncbi:MAG: polysaccharide export protein [Puniceicoccales bacterium]|jgi:polysaccharide export outer membrane protein|nr:polysaccharide export protein [Puniceicoccales bacterium]
MKWNIDILASLAIMIMSCASFASKSEQLNKLVPLDEISISIFGNPDLETKTMISENGEISLPLIGSIKISGLTQDEAQNILETKYSNGYLKSPWVSINITKRAIKYVTVLGHVQKQGVVEFEAHRGLTLTEAIGKANGPTLKADISKVTLTSTDGSGKIKSTQIDLKMIIQGKAEDIQLKDGDLIYVKESMF